MPKPRPEAFELGQRYTLALGERARKGTAGSRLGPASGASLEFQDRRAYAPGDDVRHLDWKAFARTDQLLVRQYQEEIAPRVDLLVDASRSMGVDPEKEQWTVDLAQALTWIGRESGLDVRIVLLADPVRRIDLADLEARGFECDARSALAELTRSASALLRPRSVRILLSDLLSPIEPVALVRGLRRQAGELTLVQLCSSEDTDPTHSDALRLVDSETGESLDLVVDDSLRAEYRDRFQSHRRALSEAARSLGARFVALPPALSVRSIGESLCEARVLAVR